MAKETVLMMEQTKDALDADRNYMKEALRLAETAAELGEVPVGAVVVFQDKIIASAYNLRETNRTATAHAELLAIADACRVLGDWRLREAVLYVTLEPCPMCAGAIVNSRIKRVVYALKDASAGCCGSVLNINAYPFNHAFSVTSGVCEEESRQLLQTFFEKQREKRKKKA